MSVFVPSRDIEAIVLREHYQEFQEEHLAMQNLGTTQHIAYLYNRGWTPTALCRLCGGTREAMNFVDECIDTAEETPV